MLRRFLLVGAGWLLLMGGLFVAASAALMPVRQEAMAVPRIYAYRGWQSAGVLLAAGDQVTLRAEGRWLYTPDEYHGPEGHARYSAPSFYPLPGVPGGALIGRIGETGRPFYVGARTHLQASAPGALYLRIDDDILSDNDGWVEVRVEVEWADAERSE
jgi:hypothetical protein